MSDISPETIEAAERMQAWRTSDAAGGHPYWSNDDLRRDDESALIGLALKRIASEKACGGPISAERMTLDELLETLAEWKALASGKTCVSFVHLCFGAASLWHQTHRQNFRAVDRKPESLSRWVLEHEGCVKEDFPAQVLAILERLAKGGE